MASAWDMADDDYSPDFSPDNALMDILPEDERTKLPIRQQRTPSVDPAQPASEAGANQPVVSDTPSTEGGTKTPEGQAETTTAIEIAGEQPLTEVDKAVSVIEDGKPKDVIEITPGMKLRTPKGEIISSDEIINQEALRPRYDKVQAEKNKTDKELATARDLIGQLQPWVDAAQSNEILSNTLTAVRNGADAISAIRGAAIQVGREKEFAAAFSSEPSGPPKPGTPEYFRETDLTKLGIEEGSPEHAAWWKGNVKQEVRDELAQEFAAKAAIAPVKTASPTPAQNIDTERDDLTRKREMIHKENESELIKLPALIREELDIDIDRLSEVDRNRVADAITRSAMTNLRKPMNLADTNWLGDNLVTEDSLRFAIAKSGIRKAAPVALSELPKKDAQPLTPSVQSKVTLDPSRPLQPGQSQGAPSGMGTKEFTNDRAYLGALNDILPRD